MKPFTLFEKVTVNYCLFICRLYSITAFQPVECIQKHFLFLIKSFFKRSFLYFNSQAQNQLNLITSGYTNCKMKSETKQSGSK